MINEETVIELSPSTTTDASIIWLHGLGADGNDFVSIVEALELPENHGIRFLFPHAPVRPVTLNGGMRMRAWYDIVGIGEEFAEDDSGILESQVFINSFIEHEIDKGIAPERIILAGFSQGGSLALHTGLRYRQTLAGILCLSGYLCLRQSLGAQWQAVQQNTPIMMMHGVDDPVVDYNLGKHSYIKLLKENLNVSWLEYHMQHTVCHEQLGDIRQFISNCLGLAD